MSPETRSKALWGILLVLGAIYFTARGPARALQDHGNLDLHFIHNAIQTFQEGRNPYLRDDIMDVAGAHARYQFIPQFLNATLLYPPPFITLFYPLGLLSEDAASVIWLLLELAAVAGLAYFSARLAGLELRRALPFLAALLFCAPIHTSLAHGQPSIFFCLLAAILFTCLREKRTVAAGIALGLLMIKPSFGVPALAPAFALGGMRTLVIGGVLNALLWAPMVARYGLPDAATHYLTAIENVQAPGADADDSRANPFRFDLLNLRSWLSSWDLSATLSGALASAASLGMAMLLWLRRRDAAIETNHCFYWTLAATFSLLAFYHRFYDAAILMIAAAAVCRLWAANRPQALMLGLPLLVFVVPGTSGLRVLLGESAESSVWVEALLVRHQVVALIFLAGVSATMLWRTRSKE